MSTSERGISAKDAAYFVDTATSNLARGLTVPKLREMGSPDASTLDFVLGEIDAFQLGARLDARVAQFKADAPYEPPSSPAPDSTPVTPGYIQGHFFTHIAPGESPKLVVMPPQSSPPRENKRKRRARHYAPDDLHQESKRNPTPRGRLQQAEAGHDFRKMLKRMGWTPAEKKQRIQQHAEVWIRKLQHAGVWQYYASGTPITAEIQAEITKQVENHARDFEKMLREEQQYEQSAFNGEPGRYYQDWDSSEGVTIFASGRALEDSLAE